MSFNFKSIDNKNNISKDFTSIYGDDIKNEENENNTQKKSYNANNNISSRIGSQYKPDIVKGDMDDVEKVEFDSVLHNNNKKTNEKTEIQNNNEENIVENNDDEKREEAKFEDNNENDINDLNENNIENTNETQFYELTTNKLVEMIKNDYDDIFMKEKEEIKKFVDNLANENSSLKLEISQLKTEIIKLSAKNDFCQKLYLNKNEQNTNNCSNNDNNINNMNSVEINFEIYEKEKEKIKSDYEIILLNNPPLSIAKKIDSLYTKLMRSKDDLWNFQKINILLHQENDKLKEENECIKSSILEEKNKFINEIIDIQVKTYSEIEANKNNIILNNNDNFNINNNIILPQMKSDGTNQTLDGNCFSNNDMNSNNNIYLFYIDKIKSLTYEKNKLLSCNYDFFVKINDLSQALEEKNTELNHKIQQIGNFESQIINLEQENKNIKIKYNECLNLINDLQKKNSELIKGNNKAENTNFDLIINDNKYNNVRNQYEKKINDLNKKLNDLTYKYEKLNNDFDDMKENYEMTLNNNKIYKSDNEVIINEKNHLIKENNELKTKLIIKEQEIIANNRENELKIQTAADKIEEKYKNTVDYEHIKTSINNIYNNVLSKSKNDKNSLNNSNNNISNFITNNSNEIAKLNVINRKINMLFNSQQKNNLLSIENEKLKNHIKEIININLESISLMHIQKFNETLSSITMEFLILKVIDYIKVVKLCFLLQKIKTGVNYSEKYLNWLNEKEYFKENNASIKELQSELVNICESIDNIKNTIKNNTLNIEKKFKNFLTKDEVKIEINNIQKKYESIISGLFEYFLKYKIISDKNNSELLILQIPIKSYNLMIENNMNNIASISQSIESWNLYVSKDLDFNNDNIFQDIINLTSINQLIDYNNMEETIVHNNEKTNNNNTIIYNNSIDSNKMSDNNDDVNDNNNYNGNNNYNENENENDNYNDNNDNDNNFNDDNESRKQQTNSSYPKESKSQYSFDNK